MDRTDISTTPAKIILACVLAFATMAGMKLFGVLHWSWWWICSPLCIPAGMLLLVTVGMFVLIRRQKKLPDKETKLPEWLR